MEVLCKEKVFHLVATACRARRANNYLLLLTVPAYADHIRGHCKPLCSRLPMAVKQDNERGSARSARGLLREIIGEVEIKEETDGVYAYMKLNAVSVYKAGAQKRT